MSLQFVQVTYAKSHEYLQQLDCYAAAISALFANHKYETPNAWNDVMYL